MERTGTEQFTDAAPSKSYLPTWNEITGSMATSCTPASKIIPLTKDTALLKSTIDGFQATAASRRKQRPPMLWSLCTAMKANKMPTDPNIEIYTVGFQLTTSASKALLKSCATKADHYYETSTGGWIEGSVPRHRPEDLEAAADELTRENAGEAGAPHPMRRPFYRLPKSPGPLLESNDIPKKRPPS